MSTLFLVFTVLITLTEAQTYKTQDVIIKGDKKENPVPIKDWPVFKTETVSQDKLEESSRQNLFEILKDQPGIDAQIYCSNCGAKRLSINGLKGEHTSLLVDGLPLHSAVSSFYGVDNIPVKGIESIAVMRGAGASLVNPEAIGGTIDILTINPLDFKNSFSTSLGVDEKFNSKTQNHSFVMGEKSKDQKIGVVYGGQFTRSNPWDEDNNLISESPQREGVSAFVKARFLPNTKNDINIRLGHATLESLGGAVNPKRPREVRPLAAQESDFEEGSVEKKYIGNPSKITDWVKLSRTELALTAVNFINDKLTLDYKFGMAKQKQSSIYQHGFDYSNVDNLFVGDTSLEWYINSSHRVNVGTAFKEERLRAASVILFDSPRNLPKDNFNSSSVSIYSQYNYLMKDLLEMNFALRADKLSINWLELSNKVDDMVFAPRFLLKHNLNAYLTQRFSYGLGYRTPLTFFESQHGNNESGYEMNITKIEKAHSFVYNISYNKPNYYITGGAHYTYLKNMAYGFESPNQPILYQNSEENFGIGVFDLLLGYKVNHNLLLETSLESFHYQDKYTKKLPTAAIEKRLQFKSSFNKGPWGSTIMANIIGARDLSRYSSYADQYVNRNQSAEPKLDPNLEKKWQRAPTFFTLDADVSYSFFSGLKLGFKVENIFNYTQAGEGDSPAAWHWHYTHAHYDGLHNWGPNTGRQFFVSVTKDFY